MQQDRIIGAAGEGHYAVLRAWAARPEFGNSLLVKAPLDYGAPGRWKYGPRSVGSGRDESDLPGGGFIRIVVTHFHAIIGANEVRDRQAAVLLEGLGDDAPCRCPHHPHGRLQRGPRRSRRTHGSSVEEARSAYAEANGTGTCGDMAVRAPGTGDRHRRRAEVPRLHLGPRADPGRRCPSRVRPPRPRRPRPLPERPFRDRRLISR